LNNNKILLTGGAGYVGAHVNKYLNLRGYSTVVLDNLVRGHREFVKWGEFVQGDVGDVSLLRELLGSCSFNAVLHFAAYAYVGESVRKPMKYWRNNVGSMATLLDACIEFNVKNFVFSSTCSTYGVPKKLPISEGHPQNPINPYGSGKLALELMLKDLAAANNFNYFLLRYFNAAGADPDSEIGEKHIPETHLIPLVLNSILNNEKRVQIFGNDYPTKDGTCVRDYIHVTDLADAHFRALQYLESGGDSRECNLGLGTGFSVAEIIDSVQRVTKCKVRREDAPRRDGDPPVLIADPTVATRTLGWTPQFTDLDSIIKTAWDWHRKN
jgi:UDP-glucose 4-epimerase